MTSPARGPAITTPVPEPRTPPLPRVLSNKRPFGPSRAARSRSAVTTRWSRTGNRRARTTAISVYSPGDCVANTRTESTGMDASAAPMRVADTRTHAAAASESRPSAITLLGDRMRTPEAASWRFRAYRDGGGRSHGWLAMGGTSGGSAGRALLVRHDSRVPATTRANRRALVRNHPRRSTHGRPRARTAEAHILPSVFTTRIVQHTL